MRTVKYRFLVPIWRASRRHGRQQPLRKEIEDEKLLVKQEEVEKEKLLIEA